MGQGLVTAAKWGKKREMNAFHLWLREDGDLAVLNMMPDSRTKAKDYPKNVPNYLEEPFMLLKALDLLHARGYPFELSSRVLKVFNPSDIPDSRGRRQEISVGFSLNREGNINEAIFNGIVEFIKWYRAVHSINKRP